MSNPDLNQYYQTIQKIGKLPTLQHAKRWNYAVLRTLGVTIDKSTKSQLLKTLPKELAEDLNSLFWLAFFRNSTLSKHEFQNQVSRRSGNTDPDFARFPILAVFGALKTIIPQNLSNSVAQSLSPDVRELWQKAQV